MYLFRLIRFHWRNYRQPLMCDAETALRLLSALVDRSRGEVPDLSGTRYAAA